jgi:hypothetical protein
MYAVCTAHDLPAVMMRGEARRSQARRGRAVTDEGARWTWGEAEQQPLSQE